MELGDPLAEAEMTAARAIGERLLPVGFERPGRSAAHGLMGKDVGAGCASREADRPVGHWRVEYTNGAILRSPGDGGRRSVRNTVARCRRPSSWSRSLSRLMIGPPPR